MTKDVWRYVPKDGHKSSWRGKERVVYFGPHCQEILKPYLESVGDDMDRYLFSPRDSVRLYKEKRRAARKTSVQPSQQNRAKENQNHWLDCVCGFLAAAEFLGAKVKFKRAEEKVNPAGSKVCKTTPRRRGFRKVNL